MQANSEWTQAHSVKPRGLNICHLFAGQDSLFASDSGGFTLSHLLSPALLWPATSVSEMTVHVSEADVPWNGAAFMFLSSKRDLKIIIMNPFLCLNSLCYFNQIPTCVFNNSFSTPWPVFPLCNLLVYDIKPFLHNKKTLLKIFFCCC
jgi:hypothetical protein